MDAIAKLSSVRCYLNPNISPGRVILLTGPDPGDGKPSLEGILVHDEEAARSLSEKGLAGMEVIRMPKEVLESALWERWKGFRPPAPPADELRRLVPGRIA